MDFIPRPGTKDRGGDYEINMTALYALRFSLKEDVRDVKIASNANGYGAFDDVIIRVDYVSGSTELHVIQLKHKTGKKIRLLKSELDKPKSEFALRKYKDSYFRDIKRKFGDDNDSLIKGVALEDVRMYLLTNASVENFKIAPLDSSLLSCRLTKSEFAQDPINSGAGGHCQFKINEPHWDLPLYLRGCLKGSFSPAITKSVQDKFPQFSDLQVLDEVICEIQENLEDKLEPGGASLATVLKGIASTKEIDEKILNVIKNYFAEELKTAETVFATRLHALEEYKQYLQQRAKNSVAEDLFQGISTDELGRFFKGAEVNGEVHQRLHRHYQHEFKQAKHQEYSEFLRTFWFYDAQANYKEARDLIRETLRAAFGDECAEITDEFIAYVEDFFDEKNRLLTKRDVKMKILELLTGEEDLHSRFEIFERVTDVNSREQRGEMLEAIKVSLQGRRPVRLRELTTEEFQEGLRPKFLLQNLNRTILVGADETKLANMHVIARKFYKILLRDDVLWKTKDNIFIVDVALPRNLNSKVLVVEDFNSSDFTTLRYTDKNIVILGIDQPPDGVIERIAQQTGYRFSIHSLKVCAASCLEWRRSWGDVDKLKSFKVQTELVDESDLLAHFRNTLNVVTANPGMGKSTSLKTLGVDCEPTSLVLKLDLNAHSKALQDVNGELRRTPLEYICNAMKSKSAFEDDLLAHLRAEGKVILFVDSFDEISPKYSDAALSIIAHAQKRGVTTWVFTRPFAESQIEKCFRVMSISMRGFSRDDIEDYLRKKWGLSPETSLTLTDSMVSFYAVPHYLHMLANICGNPSDLPELKVADLYGQFIEKAFDVHLERRRLDKEANQTALMISEYKETYLKVHTTAALCVIFGRQYLKDNEMVKAKAMGKMDRHFSEARVNFELIVAMGDEVPIFSHRTYAEYLAAAWLYKKLCKSHFNEAHQILAKFKEAHQVLFKEENESVRLMFDRLSSSNNPLHLAVLEGDVQRVETLCCLTGAANEDSFGRTPLHFALSYLYYADIADQRNLNGIKIADLLAVHFKDNDAILGHADSLLGSDYFQYSEKTGNFCQLHTASYWGAANILRLMLSRENLRLERYDDYFGWMALHAACHAGFEECVRLLIQRGANVHLKTLYARETAMHVAAGMGHIHILKLLLEHGGEILRQLDASEMTVLQYVSTGGVTESVRFLIEFGEDINFKTETLKQTAVHFAAKNGHVDTLELLLEKGGNLNDVDKHNWTPLHYAARHGQAECVRCLIKKGASVNLKTKADETAMLLAARDGHLDVLKVFIEDIGDVSSWGSSALRSALVFSRLNCARFLIDNGVNIVEKNDQLMRNAVLQGDVEIFKLLVEASGYVFSTAMHVAAVTGHLDILELLAGENLDKPNPQSLTPLQLSGRNGHLECVRYLVRMGADVNIKTKGDKTAMHCASEGGHLNILKVLTDKGGDTNHPDSEGWTPLHFASNIGKTDCVRYLIDAGANAASETTTGETPADFAAEKGHLDTLKFLMENCDCFQGDRTAKLWGLLERVAHFNHDDCAFYLLENHFGGMLGGTPEKSLIYLAAEKGLHHVVKFCINTFGNIDQEDEWARTPLQIAALSGWKICMWYLIGSGAEVNFLSKRDRRSAMHFGAEGGHVDVLKFLTKYGGKIDAIDATGRSALHLATLGGSAGCVRYLIDQRADVNLRDAKGLTPLHLAAQKGHRVVMNMLIMHKGNVNEVDSLGRTPLDYMSLNY